MGKSKNTMISFRVDADLKQRIEDAARHAGQSVTVFLQRAAERAVRKVESMPVKQPKRGRGEPPTFFKAQCETAVQGGSLGYHHAGYELARHLPHLGPYDAEEGQWERELTILGDLVQPTEEVHPGAIVFRPELRDDAAVFAWFERWFPRSMALVPKRRRSQFLAGVYAAADDEVIELTFGE